MRFACSFFLVAASLVIFLPEAPLYAQPAEWGEVPRDHLEMTAFPADSNASAVILSDAGKVSFTRRGRLIYERHRRIKMLTEEGYDWGTVELTYHAEDRMERVRKIDGQTFTLAENGEVERHELDGDDVFEEDVDGTYERKRFTLPALEPGAVIEYRYKIEKRNPILMPEWSFQASEPTLWSEYEVEIPNRLYYVRITKGVPDFAVEEERTVHGQMGTSGRFRWAMEDVPALRDEPFMTTPDDYRASIAFQLKQYRTARGGVENFMTSWEDLAEKLLDRRDFGRQLNSRGDVETRAELVTAGAEDAHAKMKAVYDYVRTRIEWDGSRGYIPDRDADEVLAAQSGSQAGIAVLLTAMLRNVGLEAHPVLVSTRDHGRLQPVYPYLAQFNSVLVYVEAGERAYLLDATDPLRPYDVLPEHVLNGHGWMVAEGGGTWIDIPPAWYRRRVNVVGTLAADGALDVQVQVADDEYSALRRRAALQETDEAAFVRDRVLAGLDDVDVASYEIRAETDIEEPLLSNATFQAPAYAQAAGDFMYFNPVVVGRRNRNPLRSPTRTFPIDFAFPRDLTYMVSLQLPEGFSVQEMPENVQVQLPDKGGMFQRIAQVSGQQLMFRIRFVIANTQFEPEHYEALREFYERVVAAHAEQVVLKREAAPDGAAGDVPAGGEER